MKINHSFASGAVVGRSNQALLVLLTEKGIPKLYRAPLWYNLNLSYLISLKEYGTM